MKKILMATLLMLTACSTIKCRNLKSQNKNKEHVFVYKYDGTKQCNMGQEITLEQMQKELDGIKVYSTAKRKDGLVRMTVCGADTGSANVYEIDKTEVKKAEEKGFKVWEF